MNAQQLQEIEIDKIIPNSTQPRGYFDEIKLKELSKSISEIGLINPITVKKNGINFDIVAGERRWRASKLLKKKTISAIVKDYETDGNVAVESLIENVHRENLSLDEKGKFLNKIAKLQNLYYTKENLKFSSKQLIGKINVAVLSKKVAISEVEIRKALEFTKLDDSIKKCGIAEHNITEVISKIKDVKLQKKILAKAKNEGWGRKNIRGFVTVIKGALPEIQEALFNDEITIEQAKRISKLKTQPMRKKAIQEHKDIKMVGEGIERNINNRTTAQSKREIDKKLIQIENWLLSFRNSVSDNRTSLEKSFTNLLVCTKFIPTMDEKQKRRLDGQLEIFIEVLEKGQHLAKQIQEKL